MAFTVLEPVKIPKVAPRDKFMERLRQLSEKTRGIKKTYVADGDYFLWELFCDYLVIRCYRSYLSIHVAGNLDHYAMKQIKYDELGFETNDLDFLSRLLHVRESDKNDIQ